MKTMSIEEMRRHEWVVSWSGGKDSTATIILCHEYGIPIKEIIYVRMMYDDNTPATLPIITEFIDRAKGVFESWGYKVRIEKSVKTAVDLINSKYKRSKYQERNGKKYGVTAFARGKCKFQGIKEKTIELLDNNAYQMIGYASDETDRIHRLTDTKQSIMVELEVEEKQTFDICRKYNLLSPLYNIGFTRDGCWFCPNAGVKERKYLRDNFPELINKIESSIEICDYDLTSISKHNNWVKDYFKLQYQRNNY